MASVYILYSNSQDRFYIGSCRDLGARLKQHQHATFEKSYTSRSDDWELYYSVSELKYQQARMIEKHIKRMKSRKYLKNLKKYPEISEKLISKYEDAGSSR